MYLRNHLCTLVFTFDLRNLAYFIRPRPIVLTSEYLLQTHINFPIFLPIFPDFLERLSHLAPIY
jgi:hypothetical protein